MKRIKGLTLRHPWPFMFGLDDDPKRLENRDWAAPRREIGSLLALHGGVPPRPGERKYLDEIQDALGWVGEVFDDPDAGLRFTDDELMKFCVPGIFGVARLVEVVQQSNDAWFTGPFGWVLDDFVPINPPLADHSPSHRGLWEIEPGTLGRLSERYQAARSPGRPPSPVTVPPWIEAPELLTTPTYFTPGRPLPPKTRALTPDRLYGVAVPGDWITVIRRKDRLDWRAMRAGDLGGGSRETLELYLKHLGGAI